jgi:hypothetical protein
MEVNTGDEEGGSKKVTLTLSRDDEQFAQVLSRLNIIGRLLANREVRICIDQPLLPSSASI